MLPLAC